MSDRLRGYPRTARAYNWTMAARSLPQISEEEYLASTYEPDCEFEDGVLIERNLGTEKHSWMQAALAAYIFRRRKAWGVNVYTGPRTRLRPGLYKLPDVCMAQGSRPETPASTRSISQFQKA